ncbi:MAG: DNA recombination protein RmuC [Pseudomonadota bacterium]
MDISTILVSSLFAIFLLALLIYLINKYLLNTLLSYILNHTHQAEQAHQAFIQNKIDAIINHLRADHSHLSEQVKQLDQRSKELWLTTRADLIENLLEKLNSHTQKSQSVLIGGLESNTRQINERMDQLSHTVNQRLATLSEQVEQRLQSGFQSTHETFTNVMSRLATIDEAQKKIESLSTNVMNLNQILGDKRARGAFGEVQLEHLISNSLPPSSYSFQTPLPNHSNTRPDCFLILPPPTNYIVIDAKFPLETYQKMHAPQVSDLERAVLSKTFQQDIRRHIDAVATKYILPPDTADSAMLFIPAESVFAEIHANHPEIVNYSHTRRVWLVSPTTLMAVLNTARSVIRDKETREHILIIQRALSSLSTEFGRFDDRMQKLVKHIKQVSEDVGDIHVTSHKISRHFRSIEKADIGAISPHLISDPSLELPIEESTS